MNFIKKIYNKINPPAPSIYGKKIFMQKSWLTKQMEEAVFQQTKNQIFQIR